MSEVIDQEAALVRIRRDVAESDRFWAEQRKLMNEAAKLRVDTYLGPVLGIGGLIVGGLGLLVAFARH